MLFPEIRRRMKSMFEGEQMLSLNLKQQTPNVVFNSTVERDFLMKYPQIYAALSGGMPSWTGESVSYMTALQNPTIWVCRSLIAGTMGSLPATLMQDKDGEKREAKELPMYESMKWEANEEISSQDLRELLTTHCMFTGGGYAHIIRRSGTGEAIQLRQLLPENVDRTREKTGQKRLIYDIKENGVPNKSYVVEAGKPHDILHLRGPSWDGVNGFDVIAFAKQSIGMAIAADRNVARFWALGGRVPYHLELQNKFKDADDAKQFRENWREIYDQPHEAPMLQPGITYKADGATMRDAQSNEFRESMVPELCRWWEVSPHFAGDLSHATFSNIEELALQFEKFTLTKWVSRWEKDFRRCVLTPEQKAKGYYLHHNLDALRRGDFAARMMGYAAALQNGWLNRDEVRALEDRNQIPGGAGQQYTIQLNMQDLPLDAVKEIQKLIEARRTAGKRLIDTREDRAS